MGPFMLVGSNNCAASIDFKGGKDTSKETPHYLIIIKTDFMRMLFAAGSFLFLLLSSKLTICFIPVGSVIKRH